MGKFVCKTPDGQLGVFSTNTDMFILVGDEKSVIELLSDIFEIPRRRVDELILRGKEDSQRGMIGQLEDNTDGLNRFRYGIRLMTYNHDWSSIEKEMNELGFSDWVPYAKEQFEETKEQLE